VRSETDGSDQRKDWTPSTKLQLKLEGKVHTSVSPYLDPEHLDLEVVDRPRPAGRLDVRRLRGHADVNGDLEVVLLLADEGLVGHGVVEAFVGVDVVGRRTPGGAGEDEVEALKMNNDNPDSADSELTLFGSCRRRR